MLLSVRCERRQIAKLTDVQCRRRRQGLMSTPCRLPLCAPAGLPSPRFYTALRPPVTSRKTQTTMTAPAMATRIDHISPP